MNKTCADCIHCDVCMDYTTLKESEFAQHFEGSDVLCDHFKPKSRYIELPCAVGDKVYTIFEGKIEEITIIRSYREETINGVSTSYDARNNTVALCFSQIHFGKTIFLTKEEAEQALLRKEDEGK